LVQRFARHVSPLTTTVYTHPGDEELFEGEGCVYTVVVNGLTCLANLFARNRSLPAR